MAFKNLFHPNVATGGDFAKNTAYFLWSGGTQSIQEYQTEEKHNGNGCFKRTCIMDGMSNRNTYLANDTSLGRVKGLSSGETYSQSMWIKSNSINLVRLIFAFYNSSGAQVGGGFKYISLLTPNDDWQKIEGSYLAPEGAYSSYAGINHTLLNGEYIFIDEAQFEQNTQCTDWEFPGLDLTNQAITGHEHVNNLLLENILHLSPIQTEEYVNNVILENILNLLGIQSLEDVNDIKLLNELIISGIESCETFGELLIYIHYNLIRCDLTIKHPTLNMTVKKPDLKIDTKHPNVRRSL